MFIFVRRNELRAAFGTARFFLFPSRLALSGFGFADYLFLGTFDDLGCLQRISMFIVAIYQRKDKKREAWNDLLLQARKETVQPIRFLPGFAEHGFIPSTNIFVGRLQKPCSKQDPVDGTHSRVVW